MHTGIPNLRLLENHLTNIAATSPAEWTQEAAGNMRAKLMNVSKDCNSKLAVVGRLLDPSFKCEKFRIHWKRPQRN